MALTLEASVHQWSRSEYYTMAEAGLFAGKPVEVVTPLALPQATIAVAALLP